MLKCSSLLSDLQGLHQDIFIDNNLKSSLKNNKLILDLVDILKCIFLLPDPHRNSLDTLTHKTGSLILQNMEKDMKSCIELV